MKNAYTILTVNPGSTGTKLGLVRGDEILLDLNVDTPKEIGRASCRERVSWYV